MAERAFCVALFLLLSLLTHLVLALSEENEWIGKFSTKTTYLDSIPNSTKELLLHLQHTSRLDFTEQDITPEICKPIHLNVLFRHGIRNPGSSDISTIGQFLSKFDRHVVEHGRYHYLRKVYKVFASSKEKELTETGWEELRELGIRFGVRFHKLLHNADSSNIHTFVTSKQRTKDSCQAFMSSLSELGVAWSEPEIHDDLLRFFDSCQKYLKDVEQNQQALKELYAFRQKMFSKVASNILQYLGVHDKDLTMTDKEVKAAYVFAASELAVLGTNYWAQLFSAEDMSILEYASDLKNFWKRAYGHKINYLQGSELVKDVANNLMEAASGQSSVVGVFRFAHAETLLPFTSLLGLHNDAVNLTADNFQQMSDRQFKTSIICPFGANIAIILYECNTESKQSHFIDAAGFEITLPKKLDQFMVGILFKEEPVKFPFSDHHLCSLHEFIEHYSHILSMNWERYCAVRQNDEL